MTYANMDNVSSQVSGSSSVLAADWNTYVRDNFDDIKSGHVIVADATARGALGVVASGTMVFEASTSKLWVYTTGWFELANFGSGGPFAPFYSPVGMVTPFGGSAAPTGWLLCDGAAISRSGVYTALFGICSTTYGPGDGSTTFNVPNLLGRSVVGAGAAGAQNGTSSSGLLTGGTALTARTLGAFFGDLNTQLHTHAINAWATTDGAGNHTHSVGHTDQVYQGSGPGVWPPGNNGWNGYGAGNQGHSVSTDGAHNHTIPATTSVAYGTGVQQNNQPNLALTYIIKY